MQERPTRIRSKVETQERILHAASRLFLTRGFQGTSITRIAQQAGVSRAAVFWHFGSKATLVRDTWRRFLEPIRQRLQESERQRDARIRLRQLCDAYERFVDENRDALSALLRWCLESSEMREPVRSELFDLHEDFIKDLRESLDEILHDPAAADAVAVGLVSLLDGNLLIGLLNPRPVSDERRHHGLRVILERVAGPVEPLHR